MYMRQSIWGTEKTDCTVVSFLVRNIDMIVGQGNGPMKLQFALEICQMIDCFYSVLDRISDILTCSPHMGLFDQREHGLALCLS